MPDPTREQFEAAAKKVAQTAPPGLSRDDFYKLVDQELAPRWQPGADSLSANMLRGVHTISDTPEREPDTYWGGVRKSLDDQFGSGLLKGVTEAETTRGAAHPQTAGDILNLLIPSGIESGIRGVKNIAGQLRLANPEGGNILRRARGVIGRLLDPAAQTVEESVSPLGVARPKGPYQPGGSRPVTSEPSPSARATRRPPPTTRRPATAGPEAPPVEHGPHPMQRPPAEPKPPPKASTFDDMLSEEINAEMARPVTEPTGTTPPGPTQTPGGRPSQTQQQYDDLVEGAGSAGTSTEPVSDIEQQLRDSLIERSGGTSAPPSDPSDATRLRQEYGSRDAASILGDTKANVVGATGPSVSVLPEGARARIDAFLATHPSPAEIKAWLKRGRGGVPLADAHTATRLKEQGLSDAEIADLMKR